MKKPTYKLGLAALALIGMFAVWAPVLVAAQSQIFQLGELEISSRVAEEAEENQSTDVLAASTDEPSEATIEETAVEIEVQTGDSLSKIANQNNTTWQRIFFANESIKDPNVINPGDKLRIPSSDEKLAEREIPAIKALVASAPKTRTSTNKPIITSAPAVADGSVWDRLAQCESGGRWNINTGNGYYGGLQFLPSTWRGVGGTGLPHQHSREEQIKRAQILQARSGWGQWPACARKLGLL